MFHVKHRCACCIHISTALARKQNRGRDVVNKRVDLPTFLNPPPDREDAIHDRIAALDFVSETPAFTKSARTRLRELQSLARTRVQNRESSRLERGRREPIDARRISK